MKVLVVGSGGREHAIAWHLSASGAEVHVAPGNGGTASDRHLRNVAYASNEALADFVQSEGIALTVVGPEAPLASGIVDVFRARGLRIFGPTRSAARLKSRNPSAAPSQPPARSALTPRRCGSRSLG